MKLRIIAYTLALWSACCLPAAAQTLDSTKTNTVQKVRQNWYWVSGGIGLGYVTSSYSSALFEIDLSTTFNNTLLTLKVQSLFGSLNPNSLGADTFQIINIGGMYGLISRNDWSFSSASIGVALSRSDNYRSGMLPFTLAKSVLGLALIAEAQIALKAYVPGVGLKVSGGLGTNDSYVNAMLIFHLGWMP